MTHNDRDDGETILKPEGWFNGLTCRDASAIGLTVNQLNVAHDDHKALSIDEQNWIKAIKPSNDGAKVVFRASCACVCACVCVAGEDRA